MSERIPRLAMQDLSPALGDALRPRVERLGYLGEFFRCAANAPEALLAFHRFTEALKEALPPRATEVIALTVATRLGNAYERHQHEQLCRRSGWSTEWVRTVEALQPTDLHDDRERAVQRLVLAVLHHQGHGVQAELDAVTDALGAAGTVAVLFSIGRYVTHSLMVNALALEPPVASIFPPE